MRLIVIIALLLMCRVSVAKPRNAVPRKRAPGAAAAAKKAASAQPPSGETPTPAAEPATPAATPPAAAQPAGESLSEDEAVLRALQSNPELRAFRKQRAVAEGQIVSATALENPRLQLQLVHFQEAAQVGFTATLKWTPPQPVEWLAKRSLARAHLDEVRYAIAEQEWALATSVRTTHATLLELREQSRMLADAVSLRRRMGELLRTRVEHGGATRIEQNLAELALLYAQRELDDVELRRSQSQSQLHALLGLFSVEPVSLRGQALEDPEGQSMPDPALLAEQAIANRPVVKASHARIAQREQALRIEKSRRWPWVDLSGRYGQTGSSKYPNDWQVGIEIPVPVLNLNTGKIKVAAAELDLEQATEQAQIQALKQSVYAACAELKLRRKILQHYQKDVLPAVAEHNRLMEIAVQGGQLDLVALLSSEENVLRGQREYSAARLAYHQALLTLGAAVGTPPAEVQK